MAKENLSPRQRMINLMYLVFIAMLAITVDQEITRSFYNTADSLSNTRLLTQDKNKNFESILAQKAQASPETFKQPYEDYKVLQSKADALVNEIDGLKSKMNAEAGFKFDEKDFDFNALNNTEPAVKTFFVNANESKPSQDATSLMAKMEDLRGYINQKYSGNKQFESIVKRANQNLSTDSKQNKNGKTWLVSKFYNQPLVAALANLEIIQTEARNIQSDALASMLQEKVDANIKFESYNAVVQGPTTVLQGEKAEYRVYIGSFDSKFPVTITGVDRTENGQGIKTLSTSEVGDHAFSGTISFTDSKGKSYNLPFNQPYHVIAGAHEVKFEKGALLSATKMNVLYRGVDNPISGSILGADNGATTLSASNGSVSGGRGSWVVRPGAGATTDLTISGRGPKGETISQKFTFRIKNVPPPQGQIRGQNVVSMPASSIPNQTVAATIPDFDFPVSFQVTGFYFKVPGKAATFVSGSNLSSVAGMTKGLRTGDVCYVFNIQATATGLGGQTLKQISPVVINVQ